MTASKALDQGSQVPEESRDIIASVREEDIWPLERTQWPPLYLTATGLATAPPSAAGQITFDMRSRGACWGWAISADTEITGPMTLRLSVEAHGADEIDLYAGGGEMARAHQHPLRGFLRVRDRITTGWLKASLRFPDQQISRPFDPVPTFTHRQPLAPGQVVPVDIALGPSATLFKAEETLRLFVAGRWLWPGNPLPADSPPPTKRPERQLHPALEPAPGGPPRPPHHSLTRALQPTRACTYRGGCPFAAQNFAICMSIFLIKIKQRRAPNGGSARVLLALD